MNDETLKAENQRLSSKIATLEELLKEYEQTAIEQSLNLEKRNAELSVSQARFQDILDTASDAIVSMDEDRKIILFNRQAQRIFGYEAAEALGMTIENLLPERFRERHPAYVGGFLAHETPVRVSQRPELFGLRKNGEEFPVEVTISKTKLDEAFILTAIVRDISEKKKFERLMLQSEKMSAVGQLAAGVSHEINNPLGVILGFAQSISRHVQPGDPLELPLKSIEREAIRCKNLVQDLLTFSRTGRGEKEPMDIKEAIEGALSLVLAQAKIKNTQLIREFSETPKITGNNGQIQQIVVNLSNNAMDAMPQGGKLVIRLQKARLDNKDAVEIQVQDTGQGIPEEIRSEF